MCGTVFFGEVGGGGSHFFVWFLDSLIFCCVVQFLKKSLNASIDLLVVLLEFLKFIYIFELFYRKI